MSEVIFGSADGVEFSCHLPPGVSEHRVIFVFRHCLVLLNVVYSLPLNDSMKTDPASYSPFQPLVFELLILCSPANRLPFQIPSVMFPNKGRLGMWGLYDFFHFEGRVKMSRCCPVTCDELTNTRSICLAAGGGCVWRPRMAAVSSARPVPFTLPPAG